MLTLSKIIILRFKLNISINFNIWTANVKYLYYVKVSISEIILEIFFHTIHYFGLIFIKFKLFKKSKKIYNCIYFISSK